MGAIKDLWESERGLVAVLLIVGATLLTALSRMTIDQWVDYTKWIFGLYAGAKTLTGAVGMFTGTPQNAASASTPAPAPAPTPPEEQKAA